ncbi:MAG: SpoIIE family protein phosphatase [Pirellulales bacterium]
MTHFQIGRHVRPCDGEAVAGDAVVIKPCAGGVFFSLIDVLGHGRDAADVALLAIRFLKQKASPDVVEVLCGLNEHLKGSRGAMAVIAFAHTADGAISFTGIGNVMVRRFSDREEFFPWPDGIVGIRFRTPRLCQVQMGASDVLLVHSDGVSENLSAAVTSKLLSHPVEAIARRIVLDHGRLYDDAACIAARYEP